MQSRNELLNLLVDMSIALRSCQQDEIFCGGITFNQFYILELISHNDCLKLSRLHALLSVEKSTSTRLVDPLVKQQLVIREKCGLDCRSVNLSLSPKGEESLANIWECLDVFFNRLTEEIPEDKRASVFEGVSLFAKAVKKVFGQCT